MDNDYRLTRYCKKITNIIEKKQKLLEEIKIKHPKAQDFHRIICNNESEYKRKFIELYDGRCAYCGTSIKIIPSSSFEIDHFIPKTSKYFKNKAEAGNIKNLVLACHTCNHNKSNFELSEAHQKLLNPDSEEINKIFYRHDEFYIKIYPESSQESVSFYEQLQLGRETCRIDYLLLNMMGLYDEVTDKIFLHDELGKAIELLRSKRNIMG